MSTSVLPLQDPRSAIPNEMSPSNPFVDETRIDTAMLEGCSDLYREGENSDGDDASSMVSETSTVEYGQESFSSFQHRATELILKLFPNHSNSDIQIERMKGGADNRVIGITLSAPHPKLPWYAIEHLRVKLAACVRGKPKHSRKSKKYILRIPRSSTHDLFHQITTLAYLKDKLTYPVPKVVVFDSSKDNALERPYMLQERLPGQPLTTLWGALNNEQRRCAAKCIAEVVRDLHQVTNKCAGVISERNTPYDLKMDLLRIEPVPVPQSSSTGSTHRRLALPQSTRDFLLDLCKRQREHAKATGLATLDHVFDGFVDMINGLCQTGLLPDKDTFHLYHADLQSRNLLFTLTSPTTVRLTGILDWDSALFAPKFMSTRAPFFLWTEDDADENAESDAVVEVTDPEKLEYKRNFEDVVGAGFHQDSYRTEYILARSMWYFLVRGIRSGGDVFLAEEVLEEWEGSHRD